MIFFNVEFGTFIIKPLSVIAFPKSRSNIRHLPIRVIFFSVSLAVGHFASGQMAKNSFLLGGYGAFAHNSVKSDNEESHSTSGFISLSFGKAVRDNTVAGLDLFYYPGASGNTGNGIDTINQNISQYRFGGFLRRYRKLGHDFSLFAQADAMVVLLTNKEKLWHFGKRQRPWHRRSRRSHIGDCIQP